MKNNILFLAVFAACFVASNTQNTTIDFSTDATDATDSGGILCSEEVAQQCSQQQVSYLPDPEDCSAFCECSNGFAVRFYCPDGTYWSENINTCDYEENVDCGDRPAPSMAIQFLN